MKSCGKGNVKSAYRGIPVFVEVVYCRDAPMSTFTKRRNMALDHLDLHVSFESYLGRVPSIPVGVITVASVFGGFGNFSAVHIGIMFWVYYVNLPAISIGIVHMGDVVTARPWIASNHSLSK